MTKLVVSARRAFTAFFFFPRSRRDLRPTELSEHISTGISAFSGDRGSREDKEHQEFEHTTSSRRDRKFRSIWRYEFPRPVDMRVSLFKFVAGNDDTCANTTREVISRLFVYIARR